MMVPQHQRSSMPGSCMSNFGIIFFNHWAWPFLLHFTIIGAPWLTFAVSKGGLSGYRLPFWWNSRMSDFWDTDLFLEILEFLKFPHTYGIYIHQIWCEHALLCNTSRLRPTFVVIVMHEWFPGEKIVSFKIYRQLSNYVTYIFQIWFIHPQLDYQLYPDISTAAHV